MKRGKSSLTHLDIESVMILQAFMAAVHSHQHDGAPSRRPTLHLNSMDMRLTTGNGLGPSGLLNIKVQAGGDIDLREVAILEDDWSKELDINGKVAPPGSSDFTVMYVAHARRESDGTYTITRINISGPTAPPEDQDALRA